MNDVGDLTQGESEREEQLILAALARLGGLGRLAEGGADAEELRLYTEVAGLLPYELEPLRPSESSRERLLQSVRALRGSQASSPSAEPSKAGVVVPLPTRSSARLVRRLGGVLAAGVALLSLATAGRFYRELQQVRSDHAGLQAEHTRLMAELEQQGLDLAATRERLSQEQNQIRVVKSVVATRGVEVCPLRPVGEESLQPAAFAVLYMAPGRGSWYLKASNLLPAPEGHVYRVWFATSKGAVRGGELLMPGSDVSMPVPQLGDAAMTGVMLTLEPAQTVQRPAGPVVLFGADKMQVL